MNRLFVPLALVLLCLTYFAQAQEKNPLLVSGDILTEASKCYDSSKYKQALALYRQIDRNDTNYTKGLYGISLCYYEDSQFDASLSYVKQALALHAEPELEGELYAQYGNILNESGRREEALRVYDSAIKKYPAYSLLYVNKGAALIGLGRLAEAEAVLKQSLLINPYSYSSHFKLGYCAIQQGKLIPAFLSFMGYLLVQPEGQYRTYAISWMSAIAKNMDTIQTLINNRKEPAGENYQLLEQIVQSKIALEKGYTPLLKLDDPISRQMQVVFEKMEFHPEDNDFWMQYYIPWFKSVFTSGKFELFANRLFLSINIPLIQDYVKKHKKELDALTDNLVDYLDRIIVTRDLDYTKRQTDSMRWSRSEGSLKGYGLVSGDNQVGPWTFFYGRGNLRGKGTFNTSGGKEGDFQWYYYDGKLNGKEFYRGGKQQGEETYYFDNGLPVSHSWYKDDSLDGESTRYYYMGTPRTITHYRNGKEEGARILFRSNGDTSEVEHYSAGKLDGEDRSLNKYGTTDVVAMYKNGLLEGPYKKYAPNGQLIEQGQYIAGKQEGEWKWWHPNGQLKLVTSFTNDQNNGERKEYFENGQLKTTYLVKMDKIVGDVKAWDEDGKISSLSHYDEAGRMQKMQYFDKTGKVLSESTRDKDKKGIDLTEYLADGCKLSRALFDDKQDIVGVQTTWFSSGKVFSTETHANGQLDGPYASWYSNGNKRSEMSYTEGKLDGYRRTWYKHGQLQEEGWYKDGEAQGYWIDYNEQGAITDSTCYRDDELVGYKSSYEPDGRKSFEQIYHTGWLTDYIQYDTTGKELSHFSSPTGTGKLRFVYPGGRVRTEVDYKNGKMNGTYRSYYFDGKPSDVSHYTRGLQDSAYTVWFRTGQVNTEGQYAAGEKTGLWKYHYNNGRVSQTETYDHDVLEGDQKVYYEEGPLESEFLYKAGDRVGATKEFDPDGTLVYAVNFVDGDPVSYSYKDSHDSLVPAIPLPAHSGKVKTLFPNGKTAAEFGYSDSQYDGDKKMYFTNGQLRYSIHWDHGIAEGPYTLYYPNGKTRLSATYLHDNLQGAYKKYDDKGVLREEWNYYNGSPNGVTRLYDENGKLIETDLYYYGLLLSAKK